jgi:hypothetical protein
MLKIEKMEFNPSFDKVFPYGGDTCTMGIYTYKNDILVVDAISEELLKKYEKLGAKISEEESEPFNPTFSSLSFPASTVCLFDENGQIVQRDIKRKTNSTIIKLQKMKVVALEYVPFSEFENYVVIGSDNGIITVVHFLFEKCRVV